MWCYTALMVVGDRTLVVTFEEDGIFGGVRNLSLLIEDAGARMMLEKGTWARAVETRERLVMEWEKGHRQEVEDINTLSATRVLDLTSVILMLGARGLMTWDSILDCSFSRWKMNDVRDEVSLWKCVMIV